MLSINATEEFQATIWDYYHAHGRELAWRMPEPNGTYDPYKIMVSEIMLQQTQVNRVEPKYAAFIAAFPDVASLAKATLASVLTTWQGLGYNRRARYLREAAKQIVQDYDGIIPTNLENLYSLPGIGKNTAAAVLVYGHNQPHVFIETNIRTVYLHHFYADKDGVHDREILSLLEQTVDREHPREFYWAIMDYGTHLKATIGNQNRRSKHYAKQSAFHGSLRQIRGQVLRELSAAPVSRQVLSTKIVDKRLGEVLDNLIQERLVQEKDNIISIAD